MNNINGFHEGEIISSDYLQSTIIPIGTKLDCYVNPYGVDSGLPKGYSTYYIVDEEISVSKIMDLIEKKHGCNFSDDHVELIINSDEEDEDYIKLSSIY